MMMFFYFFYFFYLGRSRGSVRSVLFSFIFIFGVFNVR